MDEELAGVVLANEITLHVDASIGLAREHYARCKRIKSRAE